MRKVWLSARKNDLRLMLRRRYGREVVPVCFSPPPRRDPPGSSPGRVVLHPRSHARGRRGELKSATTRFSLRKNGFRGRSSRSSQLRRPTRFRSTELGNDDLWQPVNVALGSDDGEAEINVAKWTVFSSFHTPNAFALRGAGARMPRSTTSNRSRSCRLDSVLPELIGKQRPPATFLKMDTQGWDLEVLRGASGVLGDIVAIQSEVSVLPIYGRMPNLQELSDRFGDWGSRWPACSRLGNPPTDRVLVDVRLRGHRRPRSASPNPHR